MGGGEGTGTHQHPGAAATNTTMIPKHITYPHRRIRYRIAEHLIRIYNRALGHALWVDTTSDHPAWLREVWRWCGIMVLPRVIRVGAYINLCHTKKLVKDEKGVWWCENTYTPRGNGRICGRSSWPTR
jgi:hypothetical protein